LTEKSWYVDARLSFIWRAKCSPQKAFERSVVNFARSRPWHIDGSSVSKTDCFDLLKKAQLNESFRV